MIHRLAGWSACDFETYVQTYRKYGGSINMHPDIVLFFMRKSGMQFTFWQYRHQGCVTAALFQVNGGGMGLNISHLYPVSSDEVMFPIAPEQKVWLPDRGGRLSPVLRHNIRNAIFKCPASRRICHAKACFSPEINAVQGNEWRKLLAMGGNCYRLDDISPAEIAELYVMLCRQYSGRMERLTKQRRTAELLSAVPEMITGNVLFHADVPCALELVLCGESNRNIYFDVANGGLHPGASGFSPAGLMMWAGIRAVQERSQKAGKTMIMLNGAYREEWGFKNVLSDVQPTGCAVCI
ncbi:Mig-14 family protein [Enterobacter asburiae]